VTADPEPETQSAQVPVPRGIPVGIDARGAEGVQIGNQGTQINYFYNGTWISGVTAAPLVSVSGAIAFPYRGLGAFEERDAGLFFGRETAATEVLEAMSRRLHGHGLVVVSGVSGAGKSSLMRAGVLHRLRGAGLGSAPEASSWPCLVFTPGGAPLDELAARIAPLAGADAPAVRRGLAADPAGFALTARAAALAGADGSGQRRVLLLVDQCEELFTLCQSEQERQAFLTALHAAASTGQGAAERPAALVVLVIRADFEARLADYPPVTAAIQARYLLTAMTSRELQLAITRPAIAAGSSVDADLVQVLLDDVVARARSQPGGLAGVVGAGVLPLLSHTLDQAWRGRTGQPLTLADYVRTGGIDGAIARSAESAYGQLTPAQQAAARQVFTRLTATTSDGADTAAPATRSELTAGATAAQAQDTAAVLEAFAAERLLTLAADTVEISHEALLTAWPRLRDSWLAETHADRVVLTGLRDTAADWIRARRDPSFLYAGSRLEAAAEVCARIGTDHRHAPLGQIGEEFLHASRRAARRRFLRVRAGIATLLILVAGLAAISLAATRADRDAVSASKATARQRDVALSGQLASHAIADPDGSAARIQAIAAYTLNGSAEAYYAMLTTAASAQFATLTTGNIGFSWLGFGPDGKTLATIGGDGTAEEWNLTTRQMIGHRFTGSSNPYAGNSAAGMVAFSPNDQTLATISGHGTVQLWNTATHQLIGRPFAGSDGGTSSVAFSPDGKTLATINGNDLLIPSLAVRLWSVATRQPIGDPFAGGSDEVSLSVAFSPDGTTLATVGGNNYSDPVQLWNTHTRRPIGRSFADSNGGAFSVAFSPDGKILAVNNDLIGGVVLWNAATRQPIGPPLGNPLATTNSLAFSPNGKVLATTSYTPFPVSNSADDGTVQLWDVTTHQRIGRPFAGGDGGVTSVVFDPNGTMLATVGQDGQVQIWNADSHDPIGRPFAVGSGGTAAAQIDPDGTTLAALGQDGQVQLWDVTSRQPVGNPIASGTSAITAMAYSPDGEILATVDNGGTLRLWDATICQPIGDPLATGTSNTNSLEFSPDGQMLAAAGGETPGQIWNVSFLVRVLTRLCSQVGGSLTRAEWAQYVGPGPAYRNACPSS